MDLPLHGSTVRRGAGIAARAFSALFHAPAMAQEFSEGPLTSDHTGAAWSGLYGFRDVYCVDFPEPGTVATLSEGLMANDAISYFRTAYRDGRTAAFIVTSTLPAGRSEADEFDALLRNEQDNAARVNVDAGVERYRVATRPGSPQPVIEVAIANIAEQSPQGPFPTTLTLHASNDGPPHTRSAHRVFVRGTNRYEIAMLGVPEHPGTANAMERLEAKLAGIADRITESVQRCRALPAGSSRFRRPGEVPPSVDDILGR